MHVFAIYGVHGAGKSYIARPVAEDLGLAYIRADAMDVVGPGVTDLSPFARESVFVFASLAGYVHALDLARRGTAAIMDFGPYQSIPYIRWWVKEQAQQERLIDLLVSSAERLEEEYADVGRTHIFFVIGEDGVEKILQRISARNRPENVKAEEMDRAFVEYVDRGLKEVAEALERRGERVVRIPADLNIRDRLGRLWAVVEETLAKTGGGRPS